MSGTLIVAGGVQNNRRRWRAEHECHPDLNSDDRRRSSCSSTDSRRCSPDRSAGQADAHTEVLPVPLERTGGRYGLQTKCEGGGQANITIIERL
jgi:hypothetical protein